MALLKALSLASEGLVSGIRYRRNYKHIRHQSPTFLVYQLTDMCNSRCRMCNIWKKRPKDELKIDDIRKIFKSRLFSGLRWVNLTGGEPFLRKDIIDVVNALNSISTLEGIAIPSNGFMTDRIVGSVEEMLRILGKDKFLSVTLSIDGFEKTHDYIRGFSGAYKKVMATLDKLTALKKDYPNFNVGVQPTISKWNIDEIEDFYRHMKFKTGSVGFAVALTSEGFYDNLDSGAALTVADKKKISRFFSKIIDKDPQYGFYYSKLIEMFRTGKRGFGCLAGFLTVFMDPKGNIFPCPVLSEDKGYCFGNARQDPRQIWYSERSASIKKRLKNEPICDSCTMMCDFISFAKVEFIEHAMFMMLHPKILFRLMQKIMSEKNPYF
ncbi:radical SAM protein [Candidatus Woesearchaeota archaeon]|nr:radical SAM protein [Candidatus Woesearchaeota archaeon]